MKKPELIRLPKGGDLWEEITKACKSRGIDKGHLSVIGAVTCARIGYYHMDKQEYAYIERQEDLELLSCSGNVSLLNGEIFTHLHVVFSDAQGACFGGHLAEGCRIFAAEMFLLPLEGEAPQRAFDSATGLNLWQQD